MGHLGCCAFSSMPKSAGILQLAGKRGFILFLAMEFIGIAMVFTLVIYTVFTGMTPPHQPCVSQLSITVTKYLRKSASKAGRLISADSFSPWLLGPVAVGLW
jgi:hypothetical protein